MSQPTITEAQATAVMAKILECIRKINETGLELLKTYSKPSSDK